MDSYRYDPYGAPLDDNPTLDNPPPDGSHVLNPFLFTGQYLDSVTSLYDLRARNYNSLIGRLLQTDPFTSSATDPSKQHTRTPTTIELRVSTQAETRH